MIDYTKALAGAQAELNALGPTTIAAIQAAQKMGASTAEIDKQLGLATGTTRLYEAEQKSLAGFYDLVTKSATQYGEVLKASPNIVNALVPPYQSLEGAFKDLGVSVKWLEEHGGPNLVAAMTPPPVTVYSELVTTLGVVEKGFKSLAQGASDSMKAISGAVGDTLAIMQGTN